VTFFRYLMLHSSHLKTVFALSLIVYPFVVLSTLKSEGTGASFLKLLLAFLFTFLGVAVIWGLGKFLKHLKNRRLDEDQEEVRAEPTNFKEVATHLLDELTDLPLVGEPIAGMITLFPMGLLIVTNEKFNWFSYSLSGEIILYTLVTLIWVEIIEKEFKVKMCTPYLPIPISYVCYFLIGGNLLISGIEALGLYDFG
jgi:hypothetical protein